MASYRYREEIGNFAFEIFNSPLDGDMWKCMIFRHHLADSVWESDEWLYVFESAALYNLFEDCLRHARHRTLQYFKTDYQSQDLESLQHWKAPF